MEAQGTAKDPDELVLFPCTTIFSNIKEPPELELEGVVEEQEPSPPEHRLKGKKPVMRKDLLYLRLAILQFAIG